MQRHETDVVSLVFAVIFIAIGAIFVTGRIDAGDFVSIWALPGGLVATGLILAAVALARFQQHGEEDAPRTDD